MSEIIETRFPRIVTTDGQDNSDISGGGGGGTTTIYDGNVTVVDQPVTVTIETDVDLALWTVTLGGHELEYRVEHNDFSWADENTVYAIWYVEENTWETLVFDGNDDPIPGTYALNIVAPASVVEITSNGVTDVSEYSAALVNVPASAVVSGTKQITANGSNIDVTDYAAVDVNVGSSLSTVTITVNFTSQSGGEARVGNVVENGQVLYGGKKLSTNGTYTLDILSIHTMHLGNDMYCALFFPDNDSGDEITVTLGTDQIAGTTGGYDKIVLFPFTSSTFTLTARYS